MVDLHQSWTHPTPYPIISYTNVLNKRVGKHACRQTFLPSTFMLVWHYTIVNKENTLLDLCYLEAARLFGIKVYLEH